MDGFIRGGSNGGTEVDLLAILPPGYSGTKERQEVIADAFEKRNSIFVTRPWESEFALSKLTDEERETVEKRIAVRKAAIANSAAIQNLDTERVGMSPDVAEKQLRILLRVEQPDATQKREIHRLQEILKVPKIDFSAARSAANDKAKKELAHKLAEYQKQDKKQRAKIVESIRYVALLQLIRDTETELEIQKTAVQRIAELELTA